MKNQKIRCPGRGFQIEDWNRWDEEIHGASLAFRDWYGMYPNRAFCSSETLKRVKQAFWDSGSPKAAPKASAVEQESGLRGTASEEEAPLPGRFFFTAGEYVLVFEEKEDLSAGTLVLIYAAESSK